MSIFMGLQHALAMAAGIVSIPIILGGNTAFRLGTGDIQYLVSVGLILSGLSSLVQVSRFVVPHSVPLLGGRSVGTGMVSIAGTSFTFVPIAQAAAKLIMQEDSAWSCTHDMDCMDPWAGAGGGAVPGVDNIGQCNLDSHKCRRSGPEALGAFLGTCMVCCLLEIALSLAPTRVLRRAFPAAVTGVCVSLIGAGLTGTAFQYWGGGPSCASAGVGDSGASVRIGQASRTRVDVGVRPAYLVEAMPASRLKAALQKCLDFRDGGRGLGVSRVSIGHRGAPLMFPEHTAESYRAAARQGAGIIECDVAVTADGHLVCRHSQCDLHTSTDILLRPALSSKCSQPFQPYDPATNTAAAARCCTSDVTLAEFKQLCGKMDGFNAQALTAREFLAGTPAFRTDLFSRCARLVSHDESIALIDSLDRDFAPELKAYSPPPADAGVMETNM